MVNTEGFRDPSVSEAFCVKAVLDISTGIR